MQAQVWRNLNLKAWEATPVSAGRPVKEHVKDRSNSKRLFVQGATRAEALANLHAALKA